MVPAPSDRVPRVPSYSGCRRAASSSAYGAFTLSGLLSQNSSARVRGSLLRSEPRGARAPVCPLPLSLAATHGIDLSFSSSPYLDVSVRAVPLRALWIHARMLKVSLSGLPHSDARGSQPMCGSPRIFAAYRVLLRPPVPRHPPPAFPCLTFGPCRPAPAERTSLPVLALACASPAPSCCSSSEETSPPPSPLRAPETVCFVF